MKEKLQIIEASQHKDFSPYNGWPVACGDCGYSFILRGNTLILSNGVIACKDCMPSEEELNEVFQDKLGIH